MMQAVSCIDEENEYSKIGGSMLYSALFIYFASVVLKKTTAMFGAKW